ncbi:unnamed protein product [Prorocentrum cordatum]|uniref:Uncharacterized protein n=1 Tax=Prorocentrum cordatum TaxID=2364126 RepID=A0ABN9XWI2_9DINO|nr:unnamed protein product [Polarella glacialis]
MSQPNKNERKRLLRLSCPVVAAKRAASETKASLEEEAPDAAPDAAGSSKGNSTKQPEGNGKGRVCGKGKGKLWGNGKGQPKGKGDGNAPRVAPAAAPPGAVEEATKNAAERRVGLFEETKTWTKFGEPKAKAVVAWSLDASESVGALVDAARDKKHKWFSADVPVSVGVQKALDKYLETQRTAKHLAVVTFRCTLQQQQWVWTEGGVSEWQTPRWVCVLLDVRAP